RVHRGDAACFRAHEYRRRCRGGTGAGAARGALGGGPVRVRPSERIALRRLHSSAFHCARDLRRAGLRSRNRPQVGRGADVLRAVHRNDSVRRGDHPAAARSAAEDTVVLAGGQRDMARAGVDLHPAAGEPAGPDGPADKQRNVQRGGLDDQRADDRADAGAGVCDHRASGRGGIGRLDSRRRGNEVGSRFRAYLCLHLNGALWENRGMKKHAMVWGCILVFAIMMQAMPAGAQNPPASQAPKASAATPPKTPTAETQKPTTPTPPDSPLKDQKDKISYAIGMNVGINLHKNDIAIDVDLLVKGLKDSMAGGKMLLTEEEEHAVLMQLTQEIRAKQEERAKLAAVANKKEGEAFLAENKAKEGVV